MPIGTGIIYNAGDLILGTVSGSGTAFLETKIAAATSSIVYFDSNARINSASLNSITVGTASYVSGSTSIITNLTASNISASGTSSFGYVGIGTNSPNDLLQLQASSATAYDETSDNGQYGSGAGITITNMDLTAQSFAQVNLQVSGNAGRALGRIVAIRTASATSDLAFVTENANTKAEKMRILSDGNLGIGTTAPGAKLEISSSTAASLLNVKGAGGNGLLFVSGSGIVGIGTASPANSKLHIYADHINGHSVLKIQTITSIATSGTPSLGFFDSDGTRNTLLYAASDGTNLANEVSKPIIFSTNSTERMRIDSGGAVGIGTSTVSRILHAYVTTGPVMRVQSSGSNASIEFIPSIGHNRYNWLIGAQQNISDAFEITPSTATNGTTFTTPAILVASSGNIGIGTTSPTQRLDLSGSLRIRSAGTYSDPADNAGFINYDSTGGIFTFSARSNGGNTYMAFRTSDAGTAGERMRIINDGNVGIGTTSPSVKLHVDGFFISKTLWSDVSAHSYWGNYSTAYGRLTWDTGLAWINATTGNVLYLGADGANKHVTIATSGNVGIGTSSPQFLLDVVSTSTTPKLRIGNAGSNNGAQLILAGSNTTKNWVIANQQNLNGTLEFTQTNATGSSTVDTTPSMVINSSGNVGIGTTSPTDKLSVIVSAPATLASTSDGLRITDGTRNVQLSRLGSTYSYAGVAGSGSMLYSYDKLNIVADTSNPIIFNTGGSERVRIDSGGSVLIGVNGAYNSSRLLQVKDGLLIGNSFYTFASIDTSGTADLILTSNANPANLGSNSNIIFKLGTSVGGGPEERMRIVSDGKVVIGATTASYKLTVQNDAASTNALLGLQNFSTSATTNHGVSILPILSDNTGSTAITAGGLYWLKEQQWTNDTTSRDSYLRIDTTENGSASEKVRIKSDGNVGIGTTSPAYKLHVAGPGFIGRQNSYGTYDAADADLIISNYNNSNTSLLLFNSAGAYHSSLINYYNNILSLGLNNDNSSNSILTSTAINITSTGVGIGTSSPIQILSVIGATEAGVNTSTTGGPAYYIRYDGANGNYINSIGAEYSSGNMILGYGATGKANSAGYVSTFANFSGHRSVLMVGNGTLEFLNSRASLSTTVGSDVPMTSSLYINNSGNVGIGTTSPGYKLEVTGTGFFSSNLTANGVTIGASDVRSSSNILTLGGTSERIRIDTNGNVGIGTTSPGEKLTVSGSSYIIGVTGAVGTGTAYYLGDSSNRDLAITRVGAAAMAIGRYYPSAWAETIRFTADGNIGIGTTSPADKLHVIGNIRINGGDILNWGGQAFIQTIGANDMFFRPNSTLRMILTAAGNLGLGNGFISPAYLLDVSGSSRFGFTSTNTHQFTGSVSVVGSVTAASFTGSLSGSITSALTASYLTPTNSYTITNLTASNISASGTSSFGYVGIGTSSPAVNLEVLGASETQGTIRISGGQTNVLAVGEINSALEFAQRDASVVGLVSGKIASISEFSNGAYAGLGFYTAQQGRVPELKEAVRITHNGDVGIGTTSPSSILQIGSGSYTATDSGYNSAHFGSLTMMFRDAYDCYIGSNTVYSAASWVNKYSSYKSSLLEMNDGKFVFYTGPGTTAGAASSLSEKMRITADGDVGIGTTSPERKLHLYAPQSVIKLSNTSLGAWSGLQWSVGTGSYTAYSGLLDTDGRYFIDVGSNGEDFTILQNGNIGINQTSPGYKLDVNGTVRVADALAANGNITITKSGANLYINGTNSDAEIHWLANGSDRWAMGMNVGDSTENLNIYNYTTTTTNFTILKTNGNVGIGSTSPTQKLDVSGTGRFTGTIHGGNNIELIKADGPYVLVGEGTGVNQYGVMDWDATNNILRLATQPYAFGANGGQINLTTSGNVGIGTTNPVALLDVSKLEYPSLGGVLANFSAGTTDPTTEKYVILRQTYTGTAFDSPMLVFRANANSANSGSFGIVRTTSNGSIVFSNVNATSGTVTAVSEKMRINSDGNVGIGTTSPATILQVVGTGVGSVGTINIKGASAHLGLTNAAGTFKGWYGYYNSTTHGSDNDLNIKTGYAGTSNIRFSTDGDTTAAMLYIKSDGNVGIGTTSPVARLSVVPSGSAFDSSNTMVAYFGKNTSNGYGSTFIRVARFDSTTTTGSNVEYTDIEQNSGGSTPFRYGTYADTNIINGAAATNGVYGSINFVTSGSTRMTIAGGTSAGNVGIGTTTPNSTLQIAGTSTGILTVGTLTNDWGGVVAIGTTNGNGIILSKVNTANDSNRVLVLMRDDTNGASIIGYTPTGTSASVGFQIRASASSYFNGGNVGIGTTSPSDGLLSLHGTYPQLNINNPSTGSGVVIQLRDNGRAAGAIGHFTSTNYLQFSTAGQTAQITLTDTGNVGIGTTSPASRLHVVGSEAYIRVTDSDDSGVFFIGNTSGFGYIRAFSRDFRFLNAAGTSLINIASGGNIGIGMTTPEAKLQTYATNTGSQFLMSAQDGVNSLNFGLGFSVNSQTFATIAGYYTNSGGSGAGDLTFYTKTTSTSLSEKMRIQADGNVGIGTTSPAYLLHVNSTGFETVAKFRGGNDTTIIIGGSDAGGSGEQYITYQNTTTAASAWMVGMDDGEDFRFAYGVAGEIDDSKTKVKIGQDGNVGIGTAAPAAKLEISGSSNSALLNIKSPISGAILFVSGSGAVGINTSTVGAYTLQVNGSFAATTKSFIIDHPTKAGKKLIYGSLESPYHGIRLTGRDTLKEGKCKVELPDYIYKLILHDSVNIQLTGIKCNKTLYVDEINIPENYFTIAYDNAIFESYKDYDFFWDFTGIRTDVPELITEL